MIKKRTDAIGHNLPKNGKTCAGRHKKGSLTEKSQLKSRNIFTDQRYPKNHLVLRFQKTTGPDFYQTVMIVEGSILNNFIPLC